MSAMAARNIRFCCSRACSLRASACQQAAQTELTAKRRVLLLLKGAYCEHSWSLPWFCSSRMVRIMAWFSSSSCVTRGVRGKKQRLARVNAENARCAALRRGARLSAGGAGGAHRLDDLGGDHLRRAGGRARGEGRRVSGLRREWRGERRTRLRPRHRAAGARLLCRTRTKRVSRCAAARQRDAKQRAHVRAHRAKTPASCKHRCAL